MREVSDVHEFYEAAVETGIDPVPDFSRHGSFWPRHPGRVKVTGEGTPASFTAARLTGATSDGLVTSQTSSTSHASQSDCAAHFPVFTSASRTDLGLHTKFPRRLGIDPIQTNQPPPPLMNTPTISRDSFLLTCPTQPRCRSRWRHQPELFLAVLAFLATALHCLGASVGAPPTAAARLATARVFERPLIWMGDSAPPDAESQALWDALQGLTTNQWPTRLSAVEDFISSNPQSGWVPSLRSQLGEAYRQSGRYTLALQHWELAWNAAQASNTGAAKLIGDYTLAHWTRLLAGLGRLDTLQSLRQVNQGRILDYGPLSQMWARTCEAVEHMGRHPGDSYKCGTYALYNVAIAMNLKFDVHGLLQIPSATNGFSMAELAQISSQLGLGLIPVVRQSGATIPVPSVVHWSQNHYAAIVRQNGNFYFVVDPTFEQPRWIAADIINAEASGYFMVSATDIPPGFTPLSSDQAALIRGQGHAGIFVDSCDQTCDTCPCPPGEGVAPNLAGAPGSSRGASSSGSGSAGCSGCAGTRSFGMATFRISEPWLNIWAEDTPLTYQPPLGPRISLDLVCKQRDEGQPFLALGGSFGNNWKCGWLGVVGLGEYTRYGTFDSTVYYPLAGSYHFPNPGISTNYFNPLKFWAMTNSSGALTNIELLRPDGGIDVYGFWPTNDSGGQFSYCFLSQRISPEGYITTFLYDAYDPAAIIIRLRYVVDANGGTNTITYPTTGNTNLISQVTDPFGRSAYFYYDDNWNLTNITDEIGLQSHFVYDENGWLTNLTTPYGVTSFAPIQVPGGIDEVDRSVTITQPDLGHQLYAFIGAPPYEPASFPSSEVPTNTPLGTLDNTPDVSCSYYWNALQYSLLSTNDVASLTNSDFLLARMRHWLNGAGVGEINTLSIQREPSPDGSTSGQLTWYDYAGKTSTEMQGDHVLPWVIARVLPDGSTWSQFTERDAWFKPTNVVSTYTTAAGTIGLRTNSYVFAANDVDLLAAYEADGSATTYSYNSYHQLTGVTNAVGDVTTYAYNANGQLATNISAGGLTTVNTYYSSGASANWLQQSVDLEIKRTNSYTYYDNGLVYSHTDERGLTTTNFWDNLQRPTGTAFPDGTTTSNLYTYLDHSGSKDRLGYWIYSGYDSMRRKVTETNANGVVTGYSYCNCGALEYVTNAWNTSVQTVTSFLYDYQGNRTYTFNPDGYNVTNWFDLLGRVYMSGDGTGYRWSYFNNQGLVTTRSNACGIESVAVFDIRDHPLYSTDANGVTVTNLYDALGRVTSRGYPDGGIERFGYSARGLTAYTNQLGYTNFYAYDPAGRMTFQTNANNELLRFTNNAAGDLLSLTDGNNHTTKWKYDGYGHVTNKTDQINIIVVKYAYDPDGRLTNRQYTSTSSNTRYKYDPVGNLTNIAYPFTGTVKLQYDALNRLTNLVDSVGTTKYTYTAAGQLATELGPISGMAVTNTYNNRLRVALQATSAWTNGFAYDLAGRLTNIISKAGSFTNVYYAGPGGGYSSRILRQVWFPNLSVITNDFDPVARLLATHLRTSAGVLTNKHEYVYDPAGERTNQTRIDGITIPYGYDKIGQLKSAFVTGGATTDEWGYKYDAGWNLTQRTNGTGFGSTTTFTYNNANELNTAGSGAAYDSMGNLIAYGNIGYTYDDENRLIQITSTNVFQTQFAYDGFGRLRTRAEYLWVDLGGGEGYWNFDSGCNYLYDGWRVISDDAAHYTRGIDLSGTLEGAGGIGGLLARTDGSGHAYYHADGVGNVTSMLDGSQTQVAAYRYNDSYGYSVTSSGSLADANVYRFSSKEFHVSSGMYYYGYRFYDPTNQRWLNRDPLPDLGFQRSLMTRRIESPRSRHLYDYVFNNPLRFLDAFGLDGAPVMEPPPPPTTGGGGGNSDQCAILAEQALQALTALAAQPNNISLQLAAAAAVGAFEAAGCGNDIRPPPQICPPDKPFKPGKPPSRWPGILRGVINFLEEFPIIIMPPPCVIDPSLCPGIGHPRPTGPVSA